MAKNAPVGDGHRIGAVRGKSQTFNPRTGLYVERDTSTGRFVNVKTTGGKIKGVRLEHGK
jgi:hypothetical protein